MEKLTDKILFKTMRVRFYRLKTGQTLSDVADYFDIPLRLVMLENLIDRPISVNDSAGIIIALPEVSGYTQYVVQPCESIKSVCNKYKMSEEEFKSINKMDYIYCGARVLIKKP